jgi:biotin transport system substrate-specific component
MNLVKKIIAILFFTLLTIAGAQVSFSIPGIAVPVTLQTLGILGAGLFLAPMPAFLSMLLYLISGLFFPVFAGNTYGPKVFSEATAGYLLFFPIAAIFTSLISKKSTDAREVFLLGVMAHFVIIIPGNLWSVVFNFSTANQLPINIMWLLPGTVIKSGVLALMVPFVQKKMASSGLPL